MEIIINGVRSTDGHEQAISITDKTPNKTRSSTTNRKIAESYLSGSQFNELSSRFVILNSFSPSAVSDWIDSSSNNTFTRASNWRGDTRSSEYHICPSGFAVPTETELEAETISSSISSEQRIINRASKGNFLNVPFAGTRNSDGNSAYKGLYANLWTANYNSNSLNHAKALSVSVNGNNMINKEKTEGLPIRCISKTIIHE